MNAGMEQQVRERAYQIWIEAGMAQGLDHEHWIAAERDIAAKSNAVPAVSKRATASKSKPVVAKPAVTKAVLTKKVVAKPAKAPEAKLVAGKAKAAKGAKTATADARASLN